MRRSRHSDSRSAGPLRAAAADANRWASQIVRLKASLPAPIVAGASATTQLDSPRPVAAVGSAEPDNPPTPIAPAASTRVARGRQSPLAAGADPVPSSAINLPNSPTTQRAIADNSDSAGMVVRAVERSPGPDAAGGGGTTGDSQSSARLLTETNQQLERIRQTLEKILAKPGSVVLD